MRATIGAVILALLVPAGTPGAPAGWSTVTLPMERTAFASAVGLDPALPRALLLPQALRKLHDDDLRGGGLRGRLAAALSAPSTGRTRVPLPLDSDTWCRDVLEHCRPERIVTALLTDSRGGLMYFGLANLDESTRTALKGSPRLLAWIARQHPGALAAFGDAIHIRGDRVVTPGSPDTDETWTRVVGAPPTDVDAFVRGLLSTGDGRLAYFYDTMAHLDAPHLRFALGRTPGDASGLARSFAAIDPHWNVETHPFLRPPVDPTTVLLRVRLDAEGQLVGPRSRAFWVHALDPEGADLSPSDTAGILEGDEADASWIVERVTGRDTRRRLASVQGLLYGQRVLTDLRATGAADAIEAVRAVLRMPALVLTLERAGVVDPARVALLARCARALTAVPDAEARSVILTEWQSALALVERLSTVGSLNAAAAGRLLDSLAALRPESGRFGDRLAGWLTTALAPALGASTAPTNSGAGVSASPLEPAMLDALAGPHTQSREPVTWEGTKYVLDETAAERARLSELRERQPIVAGLDTALDVFALVAALEPAGSHAAPDTGIAALRERLTAAATADGTDVSTGLTRLERLRAAGWRDRRAIAHERAALATAAERLLAAALRSLVYACALGSPDDRVFLAGDVSLRHAFGADRPGMPPGPSPPWAFGTEQAAAGQPWHMQGSLLGLDVALGRLRLRRLLGSMPSHQAVVSGAERAALVQTMVLTPERIADADAPLIVEAIARGRTRALTAEGDEPRAALCRDTGWCGWRNQMAAWAHAEEPDAELATASLAELAWAGRPPGAPLPDAWGTASAIDGALSVTMPAPWPIELVGGRPTLGHQLTQFADLKLRLAEFLVGRHLPASLAQSLTSAALQDFIDEVEPAYPDDWLTYIHHAQSLPAERVDDYVAALAVPGGPLVPADRAGDAP